MPKSLLLLEEPFPLSRAREKFLEALPLPLCPRLLSFCILAGSFDSVFKASELEMVINIFLVYSHYAIAIPEDCRCSRIKISLLLFCIVADSA